MSESARDIRKVQTAVLDHAGSQRAVVLPIDAVETERFRKEYKGRSFWCGTQFEDGCGKRLSDKLYIDRVCHFAHYPPSRCRRTSTDEGSADHLFIKQAFDEWLRRQGIPSSARFHRTRLSDTNELTYTVPRLDMAVNIRFSRRTLSERWSWQMTDRQASRHLMWVFGPRVGIPQWFFEEREFALHVRCRTEGFTRVVSLEVEDASRNMTGITFDEVRISKGGLSLRGQILKPKPSDVMSIDSRIAKTLSPTSGSSTSMTKVGPLSGSPIGQRRQDVTTESAKAVQGTTDKILKSLREAPSIRDPRALSLLWISTLRAVLDVKDEKVRQSLRDAVDESVSFTLRRRQHLVRSITADAVTSLRLAVEGDDAYQLHSTLSVVERFISKSSVMPGGTFDWVDQARTRLRELLRDERQDSLQQNLKQQPDQGQTTAPRPLAPLPDPRVTFKAATTRPRLPEVRTVVPHPERIASPVEELKMTLTEIAQRQGTIREGKVFESYGLSNSADDDDLRARALIAADRSGDEQAPEVILASLVMDDDGHPPAYARKILQTHGLQVPGAEIALYLIWTREQQRVHAAHAQPPCPLPERLVSQR